MEKIQNLFKHNIFFTTSLQHAVRLQSGAIHITGLYKTDVIDDIERCGIFNVEYLEWRIRPFLCYQASKYFNSRDDNTIMTNGTTDVGVFFKGQL